MKIDLKIIKKIVLSFFIFIYHITLTYEIIIMYIYYYDINKYDKIL